MAYSLFPFSCNARNVILAAASYFPSKSDCAGSELISGTVATD